MERVRACLFALLTVPLASCGGQAPLGEGDFEKQLVTADCLRQVRCGIIAMSEESACEAGLGDALDRYPLGFSVAEPILNGRASFDPAAGSACLAAFASEPCDSSLASCSGVLVGIVPVGGTCHVGLFDECQDGFCDGGSASGLGKIGCSGTCRTHIATGADCTNAPWGCFDTDFCEGPSLLCTPRAPRGQLCSQPNGCQEGLACVKGVCHLLGNQDDPCSSEWRPTGCGPSLFCDPQTDKCSPLGNQGDSCATRAACRDGLTCVLGKCAPYSDVGGPCDSSSSVSGCPSDLSCDATTNKCDALGVGEGMSCMAGGCATHGYAGNVLYCDSTTHKCQQRLAPGASCTPPSGGDDPCFAGSCSGGTCTLQCSS